MKRWVWLVVLVGCAAPRAEKSAPASAPATSTEAAPVDEDGTKATSTSPPAAPTAGGAGGMIVVSPEIAKAQAQFDEANKAMTLAGGDCAQLCKALSSMTNATERLCELAGADQRCLDARAKLDAAKTKVKSTCGTC